MNKRRNSRAFTLIELLTVVAIIAMLIAIFGVGMRKVKIIQKNLQQKAAFHGMEVGLELFSKDFGEYPDSEQVISGTAVTGAQRLAEALLGRDELGFHPRSKWHPALEPASPDVLYDISINDTTKQRKPEYTSLKECGFYWLNELWTLPATIEPTPVITDVFRQNKDTVVGEKTGMPVLYFKADSTARFRVDNTRSPVNPVTNAQSAEYRQWAYNFEDNYPLIQLAWLRDTVNEPDGLAKHYQADPDNPSTTNNAQIFYEILTQTERDTDGDGNPDLFKPYNPSTFILISAGYDGIYGTKDDITNFNY